jgi:hypothetical protein
MENNQEFPMLLKALKKSGTGLFIAVLFAFSYDSSISWLPSQPARHISNGAIKVNKSGSSQLYSEATSPIIQSTSREANPVTNLELSNYASNQEIQRSTLGSTDTYLHTDSTRQTYRFDPASEICQPPDPTSPLCIALQTLFTSTTQIPPEYLPPNFDTDLGTTNKLYPYDELHTYFYPPTTLSPLIEEMIAQVDQDVIVNYVGELSGAKPFEFNEEMVSITSRYSFSDQIHQAAEYLYHFYQEQGLDVAYQEFNLQGTTLSNVIADMPGSIFPEQIYILTAHYDSLPGGEVSPGADDNASGVAGVMMAAQILSQYDFGCTLRFINFAAEEQDLAGSQHYAHQSFCSQEDVRAVINLDMIAWNTPGSSPDMDLHANINVPGTVQLAEFYQALIHLYGLNLKPEVIQHGTQRSDHASFWDYGIPSILAIQDFYPLANSDFNPYYHTVQDTLHNLNDRHYFTNMLKAAVASLAHLGCPVEEGRGEVVGYLYDRETGFPIAGASVSFHNPEWGYTLSATSGDDGYYHLSLVSGINHLAVNAPGYAAEYYEEIFVQKDMVHSLNFTLDHIYDFAIYFPLLQNYPKVENPACP